MASHVYDPLHSKLCSADQTDESVANDAVIVLFGKRTRKRVRIVEIKVEKSASTPSSVRKAVEYVLHYTGRR